MIARLCHITELSLTVLRIRLMSCSTHRNKGQRDIPQNKANSKQRTLATDEKQAGKQRQQESRNNKAVGQNLNIHRDTISEKTFHPEHTQRNQGGNAKTNAIFD